MGGRRGGCRRWAAQVLGLGLAAAVCAAQAPADVQELARYRLTEPAFERFVRASGFLAGALLEAGADAKPLFTREISVSGDVVAAAAEVEGRLRNEARLTLALGRAGITPREYALFALALSAARLAHGFIEAGLLKQVPPGPAADNVAFVAAHRPGVDRVLAVIGMEIVSK